MELLAAQVDVGPFTGQGWLQVGELLLAFGLSALVGLERQIRGKSAGVRTQTIVGTTAAAILVVSKYGFMDVVTQGLIQLDPSRVAAQIVSGIGFLGAGLILTRRGTVRGLTTAAAVWETAAIGMAAGSGLWIIAMLLTVLHFAVVFGLTAISRLFPGTTDKAVELRVTYDDGRGVLRAVIAEVTNNNWRVRGLTPKEASGDAAEPSLVSVSLEVTGRAEISELVTALTAVTGVHGVRIQDEEDPD